MYDKSVNIKLRILNKIRYIWSSEFLKEQQNTIFQTGACDTFSYINLGIPIP
jgi:hypothetical protein